VSYASDTFPILMPVRSDMDKRIEIALIKKKVISTKTALAIRLLDDKNDVFSPTRCSMHADATLGLPDDITLVDAHIRAAVRGKLDTLIPAGARRNYAAVLLREPAALSAEITAAKTAYIEEVKASFGPDVAKLQTKNGRDELKARSQARKAAARAMFDREANPMPVLPDEKLGL